VADAPAAATQAMVLEMTRSALSPETERCPRMLA
jgi:hypothetical protein